MAAVLTVISALAFLVGGMVFTGSQSAVHEILSSILILIAIVALGLAGILSQLTKLTKIVTTLDQNNWTVGKAIWRQLHDPAGKNPEPKADGD